MTSVAATVSSSLSSCSSLYGSSNASPPPTNIASSSSSTSSSIILNNLSNLNSKETPGNQKSPERSPIRRFPSFEHSTQKSPPKLNDGRIFLSHCWTLKKPSFIVYLWMKKKVGCWQEVVLYSRTIQSPASNNFFI